MLTRSAVSLASMNNDYIYDITFPKTAGASGVAIGTVAAPTGGSGSQSVCHRDQLGSSSSRITSESAADSSKGSQRDYQDNEEQTTAGKAADILASNGK